MAKFTPDNPAWELGHWDRQLAFEESQGTNREFRRLTGGLRPCPGMAILDIGCGSTYWTDLIFGWDARRLTLGDIVQSPIEEHAGLVQNMDIRDIPEKDGYFEVAHARRVVSNLETENDRRIAIRELRRVAKWVLLVDIDEEVVQNLRRLREDAGLPLPPRNAGLGGLTTDTLHSREFGNPVQQRVLAGNYYVWTRFHMPLLRDQDLRWHPLRGYPPEFSPSTQQLLCPHRLWVLKGTA
jgi:hypothetical protein